MIRPLSRPALYLGGLALIGTWFALGLLRLSGPHAPGPHPAAAWSAGLFALPGLVAMFPS